MDVMELIRLGKSLVGKVSRYELAQMGKDAERGDGLLAKTSQFDRAQITEAYENERRRRGI